MTRAEVEKALGPPDRQNASYEKAKSGRLTGWTYEYAIRLRKGGPNTNDEIIFVFFGPDGTLKHVVPQNIPKLKGIPSATRD